MSPFAHIAKLPKENVQFEHPAKGPDHCANCEHFLSSTNRCRIVSGEVRPEDWCKRYEAK